MNRFKKNNMIREAILNSLKIGENKIAIKTLSNELEICHPTIVKYLNQFENEGLLRRHFTGVAGGNKNSPKRSTTITRFK